MKKIDTMKNDISAMCKMFTTIMNCQGSNTPMHKQVGQPAVKDNNNPQASKPGDQA